MKKILTIAFALFVSLFFMIQNVAQAETVTIITGGTDYNRVNAIGKKLLVSAKLPDKIKFVLMESDDVNAFANVEGEVWVYTGLLKFVTNDHELAAVIAHEIGHIINNHVTKKNTIGTIASTAIANTRMTSGQRLLADTVSNVSMLKMSRTDEYEADATGIDLMVKSGYNPKGMISLLNNLNAGGTTVDILSTHPAGDKRTMSAYNYLSYAYASKLGLYYNNTSYAKFLEYANPIIEERKNDEKELAKFNKDQEKLKEKRLKKMEDYKKVGESGWDKSFKTINAVNNFLK